MKYFVGEHSKKIYAASHNWGHWIHMLNVALILLKGHHKYS